MADLISSILIHYHELGLKGDNRKWFEKIFRNNIKKHLKGLPFEAIKIIGARVFVNQINAANWDKYKNKLNNVMGLSNATLVYKVKPTIQNFNNVAKNLIKDKSFNTFKVYSRRQYKDFPLTSMEMNMQVGEYIQNICQKPVKLKNPDLTCYIEIVNNNGYIGIDRVYGHGGLPVGASEEAISLISSGIDSPVSSFELLKRGVYISYIHFHSYPSTTKQSIENVKSILGILKNYQIQCPLYVVPLLNIQKEIMKNAPNKYWVILFRRAMVHLACLIGDKKNINALITGENVGQVASQTLSNIRVVDEISSLPIIRPLSGMNKQDIINKAKEINTYQISTEPYQDCCSYFVPIHPATKAKIELIKKIESKYDLTNLYNEALKNLEFEIIK
tara:strand:+ start:12831 stop:13997 length:1167 start_codon:yes stop_codon:yes gene_type:complete